MKVTIAICLSCSFSSFVQFNLLLLFKLGLPLPAVVVWRVHLAHLDVQEMAGDVVRNPCAADRYAGMHTATSEIGFGCTLALLSARAECFVFGVKNLGLREAHVRLNVAKVIQRFGDQLHVVLPEKVNTIITARAIAHAPAEKARNRSLTLQTLSTTVSVTYKFFSAASCRRARKIVAERNNNAFLRLQAMFMV
jgi:hypothetical protein